MKRMEFSSSTESLGRKGTSKRARRRSTLGRGQREGVLTDKYLARQLSFKDFVHGINNADDEEEEVDGEDDKLWQSPGKM